MILLADASSVLKAGNLFYLFLEYAAEIAIIALFLMFGRIRIKSGQMKDLARVWERLLKRLKRAMQRELA